jgi:uncharacterized membrane protein
MKHLLIILFITLSFNTMAQKYALNAHHFVMADETGVIDEDAVDVDMVLDTDLSRIVIYSKETQVIDYNIIRNYVDKDNYSVIETTATDTKWKDILLTFYINSEEKTILVEIKYPSFMYIYVCKVM